MCGGEVAGGRRYDSPEGSYSTPSYSCEFNPGSHIRQAVWMFFKLSSRMNATAGIPLCYKGIENKARGN